MVMFPFSLKQFKFNINIVYTSTKVSLFWSFDLLFLHLVCMFQLSLNVVSGSINDLLAFEMH